MQEGNLALFIPTELLQAVAEYLTWRLARRLSLCYTRAKALLKNRSWFDQADVTWWDKILPLIESPTKIVFYPEENTDARRFAQQLRQMNVSSLRELHLDFQAYYDFDAPSAFVSDDFFEGLALGPPGQPVSPIFPNLRRFECANCEFTDEFFLIFRHMPNITEIRLSIQWNHPDSQEAEAEMLETLLRHCKSLERVTFGWVTSQFVEGEYVVEQLKKLPNLKFVCFPEIEERELDSWPIPIRIGGPDAVEMDIDFFIKWAHSFSPVGINFAIGGLEKTILFHVFKCENDRFAQQIIDEFGLTPEQVVGDVGFGYYLRTTMLNQSDFRNRWHAWAVLHGWSEF